MAKKEANILVTLRDRASSGLRRLGGVANKLAKSFGLVSAAAAAITTIIGVRFLSGAIRSAGQFDEAMSSVGAVTNATAEELGKLRDAADEASARTRFTAQEAAQGLEELARSGQNANEAIATLNPVLDLAAGNNQTVAESAIQVTTALNAFGLAAEDAGRVSDVYTRAAQRSAQTTGQLGEAMTFVAPVARQAGLEIEQTAALVGRLADAGFRGSLGGTALRNAILQFQDPASNFRAELERLGIRTDNFVEALEGLAGAGDGAEAAIRSLGLRAGPAIQAIVAGGVPALQKLIRELENAGGAAEDAAEQMEDNLPGAIRAFLSVFDQARRRLAAPLVERIKEEVQALTDRLREFTNSGILERFSTLLVNAFDAAVRVIREFVGSIDFEQVGRRLTEFAQRAAERIAQFGRDATALRNSFRAIAGSFQLFVGTVGAAFNGLGTIIAGAISFINRGVLQALEAAQRFSFGLNPILNKAVEDFRGLQASFDQSTAEFAARTVRSTELITKGWQNLTTEVKAASKEQAAAVTEAAAAGQKAARSIGASKAELEEFRETIARNREIVADWDRQLDQAGQTATGTSAAVSTLARTAEELRTQTEASKSEFDRLRESITRAANPAELDALVARMAELKEQGALTAEEYDNLAGVVVAASDAMTESVDRTRGSFTVLREQVLAASDTRELSQLVAEVDRLADSGELTTGQIQELQEALDKTAQSLDQTASSAQGTADSLRDVGAEAGTAATGLRDVDSATRGLSRSATSTASGFGAILDSWRGLDPRIDRSIDRFIEGFPGGQTFQTTARLIARFTRSLEDRYGRLRDEGKLAFQQTREINQELDRLDPGGGGRTIVSENRFIFEVKRDPDGPLVLSEADLNAIVGRVLAQLDADQARTAEGG